MMIKNFNDLVKGKRPSYIKNQYILNEDLTHLIEGSYLLISYEIWIFLKAWYDSDFEVKVDIAATTNGYQHFSYRKNSISQEIYKAKEDLENSKVINQLRSEKTVF